MLTTCEVIREKGEKRRAAGGEVGLGVTRGLSVTALLCGNFGSQPPFQVAASYDDSII